MNVSSNVNTRILVFRYLNFLIEEITGNLFSFF